MLFLAFSVWTRRAGPSPLRSASERRRGRGGAPARGPRSSLPRAPDSAGPGQLSVAQLTLYNLKLTGLAAEAPDPVPHFAQMPRTCWSRLDASRDSSVGGARTGPAPARIT